MTKRRDVDEALAGAVVAGDIKTVRDALARGADPNLVVEATETVLMRAVSQDAGTAIVRMLLTRGARVDAVNEQGWTALHYAALAGRRDVAEVLLARGAQVDARTHSGETPLDFALQVSQDLAVVELLRARSGGAAGRDDDSRIATPHTAGRALVIAASQGDHARVWKAVAEGVEAASLTEALACAAQRGDLTLGRGLIDVGAAPGGIVTTNTPLHAAGWNGQAAFARLLLDAGAPVDVRDTSGGTPLHAAVVTTHARPAAVVETVRVLLAAGADPHRVDREGYSPRTSARAGGREPLVALLPAGPGERPIDVTAAGIDAVVMGSQGDVEVCFRPNDLVRPISVTGGYARDPWGVATDPAGAVTRYREDLVKGGADWFLAAIEAMRDGRWPTYAEVETSFRARHGRSPEVRRFPPWSPA